MNQIDTLRGIVAKIGRTEVDKIGADFSLRGPDLQGSARKAALAAAIRRQLGVNCPAAYSVATFGELEQALFGQHSAAPAPAATSNSNSTNPQLAVLPEQNAKFKDLRCGVDIEMISEMPETPDYREHEFYSDSFSQEEIAYCVLQENPRMHFAARWCAKEALYKCDPAFRSEKMSNIELAVSEQGGVFLRHRGNGTRRDLPHAVSVSHTNVFATAVVLMLPGGLPQSPPSTQPSTVSFQPPSPPSSLRRFTLAWLMAVGLALWALLRTFR
jgi:holo-[acyl-carrier protein] synthase